MEESFLRQRRNVFIASIALLALCLGGVQLDELSLAGMKFDAFKRPEVFLLGLWIAFAYFVYRYFVYFMAFALENLSGKWHFEIEKSTIPRLQQLVRRRFRKPNMGSGFSYADVVRNGMVWKGQEIVFETDQSGERGREAELRIAKRDLFPWVLKGALNYLFLTPIVTEYILPFVLAAFTFVYCGFAANWEGSFRALIQ